MKIVINRCFGGFELSHKAVMHYAKLKRFKLYPFTNSRGADGTLSLPRKLVRWNEKGKEPFIVFYFKAPKPKDRAFFSPQDIKRNDPALVKAVEQLGAEANGHCADLGIVEIPDGVGWQISEYDGQEHVAETHRTWS